MSSPSQSFYGKPTYHTELPSKNPETWLQRMDPRLRNSLDAFLKYGTVFLIFRLCSYYLTEHSASEKFVDSQTGQLAGFILFGFVIYFALVHPYINPSFAHPIIQNVANDSLMFGTVLVVAHLCESYMSGDSVFDMNWLVNSMYILVAFAAYRVFVNPFIPFDKLGMGARPLVSDWAQFGTFLIVFRLLIGKELNQSYMMSVLFVLLGFAGYQLVTKRIMG